jgi:hypothetical protein
MLKPILAGIGAAVLLAASPVLAEASKNQQQSGTTSGPAAGSPTTLGSSGASPATPHQQQGVKDQSSSVTRGADQTEGSGSSQAPTGHAGQQGMKGNKSGPSAKDADGKSRQ